MKDFDTLSRDPKVLRSLFYFEAVARLGSVGAAAEETGVSASAISHQLRSLADHVGDELFTKSGRGVILTERGRLMQTRASVALALLRTALAEAIAQQRSTLRIAVCTSFGPSWLAKRLSAFIDQNPDLDVEIRLYTEDPDQSDDFADALVTASPIRAGFDGVDLFQEKLVAVIRPDLVRTGLLPDRLITTDVLPELPGLDWRDYFSGAGLALAQLSPGSFVRGTHYLLAFSLAKAGVGAAIVPEFVAADALASGQLVLLHPFHMPSGRTYRICTKVSRCKDPDLRALVRWMKSSVNMR